MAKNSDSAKGGIGFFGLLGIVFIVLKLVDVIDWSWWWVTSPLWGPVMCFGPLFLSMLAIGLVIELCKS